MNGRGDGQETPADGRRYPRFRVSVPVYIAVEGGTFRKAVHLQSSDVSAGGLAFETSRRIPLLAESRVVLSKLGDLAQHAFIRGRVAHRERDPATRRYRVGIEFLEFVNVSREELAERIEAWSSQPSQASRPGRPRRPSA